MSRKIFKDINGINIKIPHIEPPTYYQIATNIYKVANMLPNEYIIGTFLGTEQKSYSGYLLGNDLDTDNETIQKFIQTLPDYISISTSTKLKKVMSIPPVTVISEVVLAPKATLKGLVPTPEDAVMKVTCSTLQFIGGEK